MWGAVRSGAERSGAVRSGAMRCGAVRCSAVRAARAAVAAAAAVAVAVVAAAVEWAVGRNAYPMSNYHGRGCQGAPGGPEAPATRRASMHRRLAGRRSPGDSASVRECPST